MNIIRIVLFCGLSLCLAVSANAQSSGLPKMGSLPTLKSLPTPGSGRPMAPVTPKDGMKFGNMTVEPGKTVTATLPLPPDLAKLLSSNYGKPTTVIKVAIAVPDGFDPLKHQRVLITSASTTGSGLSINCIGNKNIIAALKRGWVVMAGDGEFGKPKEDHIYFRGNILEIMMAELKARWPQCQTQWSFATAGFSGGSGYASDQALLLCGQDWHIIGMLLLNGNYTPVEWEKDKYIKGSKSAFHQIPVFYSAGKQDPVVRPDRMKIAITQTKNGGYKTIREEWHDGKHEIFAAHVIQALEWFESFDK
jgi:hypothetical protein